MNEVRAAVWAATVVLIVAPIVAACGGRAEPGTPADGAAPGTERAGGATGGAPAPGAVSDAASDGDGPAPALADEPAVVAAVNDFAAAEGVDAADVRVVSVAEVTWPDGALGCPAPGELYTQALVPGYDVALAAGLATARYHTNRGPAGAVFVRRCPDGLLALPGADPSALDAARRDLVARVGEASAVALASTGPSAATALVCPGTPDGGADGASALQMAVTDVVFQVGADRHLYRIWNGRFLYCGLVPLPPPGPGTPTAATE